MYILYIESCIPGLRKARFERRPFQGTKFTLLRGGFGRGWCADSCDLHAPWGSLARPWGSLGAPWGSLGAPWGVFGVPWGVLGGSLGILWSLWGSLWGPWEVPGRSLKVSKGFWMHSEVVDPRICRYLQ